jgi:hypothetical protein
MMVQSATFSEIVNIWLARSGDAYLTSHINTFLYALSLFAAAHRWKKGLAYLILFVVFRGISLHPFGMILNCKILGARVNWIAELAGIYWIGLSIFWPKWPRR